MTPAQAISMLDRQLANNGEDIVLSRPNATPPVTATVTIRGRAVGYSAKELVPGSGIMQGDVKVIMSTTQLDAAAWPGTAQAPGQFDPRIPVKGDRMMIGGKTMTVQAAAAVVRISNIIVRMEAQVRG